MILYLCDPKKNTECPKVMCQKECTMATNKNCAKVLIDPDDKKEFVIYADTTNGILERLGMLEK